MKKQFKKSLALLLSLLMIITVVPLTAGAEEVSDYYTYNVDISGRAEIISVDSSISGDIIIPTYIDGYKVIKIGVNAFENCDNITSVTIPDSVYYIGREAFYDCDNLERVSFGDSLNTIYTDAFRRCSKLTDISWGKSLRMIGDGAFAGASFPTLTISDTVQSIGDEAFAGSDITEIIIPDSVTYLGEGAFRDCINLESVILSKSLETIKSETFYNCEKLTKIEIPDNIITIEEDVFDGIPILDITLGKSLKELSSDSFLYSYQTNLNSINIHDENKFFYTDGQALFYEDEVKGMTTLVLFYDKTAESYSIPDGVERIGEYAFWGFGSLKSIEIPESVLSIGKYAFANCYGLKYEYIDGLRYYGDVLYDRDGEASSFTDTITVREGTRIIADGLFEYKYDGYYPENIKMKEVILPEGVVSIGNRAFLGCKTLQKINLPDSLTYIGDEAFYSCSELACEIIPDSVEYIGDDTFSACSNIAVTSLPENLKYLGNSAFSSSKNVTQIVIPETVTYLGENNFKNIVSIDIPASVKLIEDNFNDYLKLESIHVDMNNKYFSSENGVLFNKDKTELLKYPSAKTDVKYIMPDTVLHLRNAAFWENEYITEIILSESLKDIGSNCFLACSALKCLEIPESVETIYDFFYGCDSLADIVVPGTVEFRHGIDYNVPFVKNSDNWQDGMLIVGGTLMDVDESSMTELVIPDTVKYLSAGVFCLTTLTSITIPDSVKLIPNGAFHHSKSLRELRISSSIEQIGLRPFYDCDNLTDVYYSGTAEQWYNIKKESDAPFYNEDYFGADVHFVECVFTSDFKHSYTPEITIPATHLTEGVLTFTCACGDTYTESIEKIAEHNYIAAEIVEPTCSREGYTVYICACGATCTDDYVDYDYSVHVNEDGDKICDCCGELTEHCSCNCHSTNGFIAFFWKILNFLQRLFGTNPVCECGMAHY